MYILNPEMDEDSIQQAVDRYASIVTNGQGEVVSVDKWGKRRLAYEIKDLVEGYYVLMNFKSEPAVVKELDRIMKISDQMLRFMIVNQDEK